MYVLAKFHEKIFSILRILLRILPKKRKGLKLTHTKSDGVDPIFDRPEIYFYVFQNGDLSGLVLN